MSILLQNPNRIFASIIATDTFNNSVTMEKRYLDKAVPFEPIEMYETLHKYSLQERIKCVQRFPQAKNVLHKGEAFRTNYGDSSSLTALFRVDEVIVVFLNKDNHIIKKQMRTVNGPVEMQDKIPQLENIRDTMKDLFKTRLAMLAIFFGASIAGTFLVKILSFEGKPLQKIQAVAQIGLMGITFLAGWRLIQWVLFVDKLFSMQNLGIYVAQMRAYAYTYPEIVSEHRLIQRFLLPHEVTYLKGLPSSVLICLKNNLSL